MLPFAEAHPLGQDDAACLSIAGLGPAQSLKVTAASPDSPEPAHCPICHLTRAMSGAVVANVATLALPVGDVSRHLLSSDSPFTVAAAPPASRGPPAIL